MAEQPKFLQFFMILLYLGLLGAFGVGLYRLGASNPTYNIMFSMSAVGLMVLERMSGFVRSLLLGRKQKKQIKKSKSNSALATKELVSVKNKSSNNKKNTPMTQHEFNQKLTEGRAGVIEALDFLSGLAAKHPTLKNRIGYQVNSMLAEAADEDASWRKLSDRIKVLGISIKKYFTEETP